jgi:hypothetical protein
MISPTGMRDLSGENKIKKEDFSQLGQIWNSLDERESDRRFPEQTR